MKKLFAMAAFVVAAMGASAQEEVTPRSPIVPWGTQAEIIITNDLTQQNSDGSWALNADAMKWIEYSYDGTTENGTIQQTNRPNVWFDFYDETTDTMIVTSAEKNWGGYLTVSSKTGSTSGLMIVGKNRYPAFYVTATDKVKFYFSGSAGTVGYPQIEVYEVGAEEPVAKYTGDYALTKKTWDHSTLLIADGLDKAKSYKIVARTMNALEDGTFGYEGGDIVLQVIKVYGDQAPMREDGVIISGSEIGSYINQHLATYPDVTDFTLEGSGKYTIKESITIADKFTLTGVASAPATIDASALTTPLVQFAEIATARAKAPTVDENGFAAVPNVKFANIKVNALGQPLFSSNKQNYLVSELAVDNSVIELKGNPFVIDFRNGGVVAKMAVSNSTIWAATATGNSFYTSQSGKKATEAGLEEQIFSFTNNTLSNICAGKNFFTHRQSGQTWLTFEVKNNIIANCGKDNFLASLNGGQSSPNPKYVVEGNTFLKSVTTTNEDNTETTELNNINDLQSTSDETEEIVNPVAGVPFTLANAAAGNFTVGASSQQAKLMTGDPRWLVPYATDAIKIEVDMAENTDFVKVLNEKLAESEAPSSITVVFLEAGEYPTTAELNTTSPITFQVQDINAGEATVVFNNGFTLGGAINFNGVNIKAGDELAAPVFELQQNPWKIQDNGYSNFGTIKLQNLKVSNLKNHLIKSNPKIQISEIETKNCEVYMAGKIPGSGNTPAIYDFRSGGVPVTWNFVNSTLDAADNAIFSTAGGDKAGNVAGVTMQTLNINKATIINPVKKCFQHRQNNQKWLRYILTNSLVVVNSEKPNFVAEMNAGSQGANPTWQVSGNVFQQMTDGVCVDVSDKQNNGDPDEPIVNSVAGVMTFNSLETPDFGGTFQLPATTTSTPSAFGDPRWTIEVLSAENNEHLDVTIDHERMAGLGYSASKATVDFTAAKELLGVEELTDDMLYIVNADGTLVKNFADFDGWFNVEGVAEDWFSLNAEGNVRPGLCVKFFQALDGGEFEICDMNGADEVGKTYTVKWRLTNGYKYVDYTINVKFVEFSIPEYKPEIVKTIDVPAHLITGIIYEGASASFDVNEVTSALGIESIADAKMYVVNVTDGNFVTDIYDGWRNAEGESAEWNSSTGMVAVQIHDPASGSIDWMGAIDDTHNVGDTYTAKVGFANSEDKAVVLNVNITFAGLYLVGNFTDWAVNDIYAMTLNYEQKETDEFMVTANLAADAWFKVVKYDGSNIVAWYPDGTGNAYGENGELSQGAGIYDVYFRPYADGNDDWFYNYIYVEYDADATTGIDAVAAEMQNGTVYNMQGMRVDRPTKGLYIVNGKKVVIK